MANSSDTDGLLQAQSAKRRRSGKVNKVQKELLVSELEKIPILATGKLTSSFTAIDQKEKWEALAEILNRHGPSKKWTVWRKTWQDMKSKIKTASVSNKSTAGAEPEGVEGLSIESLSPLRERILALARGNPVPPKRQKNSDKDKAVEMPYHEMNLFKEMCSEIKKTNGLLSKSVTAQEQLAKSTELMASSFSQLVNFILKKKAN